MFLNPLSASPTKWPNTLKQFVGKLPTNFLSVFGHFFNLALKGLTKKEDLNKSKLVLKLLKFCGISLCWQFSYTEIVFQYKKTS